MDRIFSRVMAILCTAALSDGDASAGEEPDLGGCFIGQIVRADSYSQIRLYRGGDTRKVVEVNAFTGLYWGDLLEVTGDQTVVIRDRPGESRPVDRSSGQIRIGEGATCEVRPGMRDLAQRLGAGLSSLMGGPLPAEPRLTLTQKGDDASVAAPLALDLDGPQKIIASQPKLTVWWSNQPGTVRLAAPDGTAIEARPGMRSFATLTWRDLAEAPAGIWTLLVRGPKETLAVSIEVVPETDLPLPSDITSVDTLTADERVIFASWLSTSGPSEWRLQGWSMLAEEMKTSYPAWRLWRGLIAQAVSR